MEQKIKQCLFETWQPEPVEIPVRKILVKEGKNFPDRITEDVSGFSLIPEYSLKQLREFRRRQIKSVRKWAHTKSAKKGWRKVARW